MSGNWGDLSVVTTKGGNSLILKHNCEILVPKKQRVNILNVAHCERTPNQCSCSAILAVKHWSNRNGLPYTILSDTDEFIKQLQKVRVKQQPSSA